VLIARGQPCTATAAGQLLCRHVERVGMLEQDLRVALPELAAPTAHTRVTLRVAVNADTLGTWFIPAVSQFTHDQTALLDVAVDDQDHTVDWLRTGQVIAAVTANEQPVQGCNSVPLGQLRYVAAASPEFVRRHFVDGASPTSLANAPSLRFNSKDGLHAQWARDVLQCDLDAPMHWLPSTQALVDASLAGMGWALHPASLVQPHFDAGTLIELIPARPLLVPLYWQYTRLQVSMLDRLTQAVIATARTALS
jgi:LysR family transcriptional regulator (chromosome initiation inhibitor)